MGKRRLKIGPGENSSNWNWERALRMEELVEGRARKCPPGRTARERSQWALERIDEFVELDNPEYEMEVWQRAREMVFGESAKNDPLDWFGKLKKQKVKTSNGERSTQNRSVREAGRE